MLWARVTGGQNATWCDGTDYHRRGLRSGVVNFSGDWGGHLLLYESREVALQPDILHLYSLIITEATEHTRWPPWHLRLTFLSHSLHDGYR